MRVGSLFSGIGGIDLGLERAGMEIAWQVEIDEWCRKVLTKHWPDVPKYGDIRECRDLPSVDVLAGGFPCQPVSHAGKRKAQDDARWLWPEFARIVREVRPRYVFVENVPGLLDGPVSDVLGELAACGYDAEWDCIPAAAVGAPHTRDRVWLLAYPRCDLRAEHWQQQAPRPPRVLGRGAADVADPNESRLQGQPGPALSRWRQSDWWEAEPGVCRVGHGIPRTMDRLRGLGNAVVPQIVEWIGRRIMEFERND